MSNAAPFGYPPGSQNTFQPRMPPGMHAGGNMYDSKAAPPSSEMQEYMVLMRSIRRWLRIIGICTVVVAATWIGILLVLVLYVGPVYTDTLRTVNRIEDVADKVNEKLDGISAITDHYNMTEVWFSAMPDTNHSLAKMVQHYTRGGEALSRLAIDIKDVDGVKILHPVVRALGDGLTSEAAPPVAMAVGDTVKWIRDMAEQGYIVGAGGKLGRGLDRIIEVSESNQTVAVFHSLGNGVTEVMQDLIVRDVLLNLREFIADTTNATHRVAKAINHPQTELVGERLSRAVVYMTDGPNVPLFVDTTARSYQDVGEIIRQFRESKGIIRILDLDQVLTNTSTSLREFAGAMNTQGASINLRVF